jgi:NTP pyrophosphatase (non-canonical NTP hydrolase)
MDLKQYVELAVRTESVPTELKLDRANVTNAFRLFTEVAKLLDGVKRSIYYNNDDRLNANFRGHISSIRRLANMLDDALDSRREFHSPSMLPADIFKSEFESASVNPRLFHGVIGIATEAGELVEAMTPVVENGTNVLDVVNLDEELGDINWYEAILTDAGNLDWLQRQERNIAKLKKRYPDKYSDQDAVNRDLGAEREVLKVIRFKPSVIDVSGLPARPVYVTVGDNPPVEYVADSENHMSFAPLPPFETLAQDET